MQKKCDNSTCRNIKSLIGRQGGTYCSGCVSYFNRNKEFPNRKYCVNCDIRLMQSSVDYTDHCSKCTIKLNLACTVKNCKGKRTRGTGFFCFSHSRDFISGVPFRKISHRGTSEVCYKHSNFHPCAECKSNAHLLRNYGITYEEYQNMLKSQHGRCAFPECTTELDNKKLFVDHNHKTGKIRGLLCYRHNFLLGNAQDDISQLLHAVEYLKRHSMQEGV